MAITSTRTVKAALNSGITVGLRSVIALGAFVFIVRAADSSALATYGICYFIWGIIFGVAQNLAAQPLIDMPRLRSNHVASARFVTFASAFAMGFAVWLAAPLVARGYSEIPGLETGMRTLLWLGPLSVLGAVDLALAQRQLRFGFIARTQTVAMVLAGVLSVLIAIYWDTVTGLIGIQAFPGVFFTLLAARGRRRVWVRPTLVCMRRLVQIGRHLAFESAVAVGAIQGPVILFGLLLSMSELAMFVVVSRFIQLIASQLGRVTTLIFLPMVRRETKEPERFRRTVMSASYLSNALVAVPLIVMFAAPVFLIGILGVKAEPAARSVFLLLIVKQLLDTFGNTVFSSFRAIGRPDAGWRWSLMFSSMWVVIAAFAWAFELGVVQISALMAATGLFSFGAVFWLCSRIDLGFGRYLVFQAPVLLLVALSLPMTRLVAMAADQAGLATPIPEIVGGALVTFAYIGAAILAFKLFRARE